MFTSIITNYTLITNRLKLTTRTTLVSLVLAFTPLARYYRINDLMWQDGLLIDFLQKKVADKWIRRFLVSSSYLYSERVLFTFVTRFYIDFVVWPLTSLTTFEFMNIAATLSTTLLVLTFLLTIFNLNYLFVILL